MSISPVPAAPIMLSHDVSGQYLLRYWLPVTYTFRNIAELDLESTVVCE